jgi:hypothetical protein
MLSLLGSLGDAEKLIPTLFPYRISILTALREQTRALLHEVRP